MMTLEEAIKNREDFLKYLEGIGRKSRPECAEAVRWSVKALKALRPVSREQVEKVWGGEWEFDAAATEGEFGGIRCSKCHTAVSFGGKHAFHNAKTFEHFCSHCGAPMTDEAVEMVMERLNKLEETKK